MDYMRKSWAKVRVVLISMPPSQRLSVVALMAVVAVSLVLLVTWGGREEFAPILTGLSGAELTAQSAALKGSGIEYKIGDGMLLVKPADRDKVFLALSEKGALPSDISKSFGFEDIVKPTGFSMETAEQQQVKLNVARQNEIARCIMAGPDVAKAQVIIAYDRDGYFGKETATAGVYVQPRTAEPLSSRRLDAICRFVAAAVGPKLSPTKVVVTNLATGETYSPDDQNTSYAKASSRIELQRIYDKYYSDRVEKFLSPAFGTVRTLVTVKVDATSSTTEEIAYEVTKKRTKTDLTTGATATGGETLTQPNVAASVTPPAGAGTGSKTESAEKEETSEPSKKTATDIPPGEIKDIGLLVMVDLGKMASLIRAKDGVKDPEAAVAQARIDQECVLWKTKLLAALPVESASKVTNVEFTAVPMGAPDQMVEAATVVVAAPVSAKAFDFLGANIHRIGLAALAVFALLLIRSIAKRAEVEVVPGKPEEPVEDDILLPEMEIDAEQKRAARVRESIEEMVRSDPQTAVGLIRRWMARES
jgi:flagellar biosynthesis/type III secretory pathway M-ring protein FliF/YscJ